MCVWDYETVRGHNLEGLEGYQKSGGSFEEIPLASRLARKSEMISILARGDWPGDLVALKVASSSAELFVRQAFDS